MTPHSDPTHLPLTTLHQALLREIPADQSACVSERLDAHLPVLVDRLRRLYGDAPQFDQWVNALMVELGKLLTARSATLRELDGQRHADRNWHLSQKQVGYCAYVDRFGGDLNGVAARIPHLRKLGVTYLHLLPFLRARDGENDGGFAVASFDEIEPAFGNMQDLEQLAAQLRQAGISLCSDFVLNHVADTHPWALAAKNHDVARQAFFCSYASEDEVTRIEQDLNQVFPQAAPGNFTFVKELQRWVWTTFYSYQWDLNFANPQVFAEMLCAMLRLANHGVEVFRLDSTAYIWKRAGTSSMNQPEVHWILQAMRAAVDIVAPGVLLKAEAIVPTAELGAYLGVPQGSTATIGVTPECHLAYHSTLMAASWVALATGRADIIRKVVRGTPQLSLPVSWLTYVRCHDDIGWNVLLPEVNGEPSEKSSLLATSRILAGFDGGFGRGQDFQANQPGKVHGTNGMAAALTGMTSAENEAQREQAVRRLMLLYGLACCFGGMPLIYMGDELAQDNDMSYLNDPKKVQDSRWMQRPFLDQSALDGLNQYDALPARVFNQLRHMLALRAELPLLAAGTARRLVDCGHDAVFGMERYQPGASSGENSRLIFVANFSKFPVAIDMTSSGDFLPHLEWVDLLNQRRHQDQLLIMPWSQCWLSPVIQ